MTKSCFSVPNDNPQFNYENDEQKQCVSFFLVVKAVVIPFSQKLSYDLFISHGNHLYVHHRF